MLALQNTAFISLNINNEQRVKADSKEQGIQNSKSSMIRITFPDTFIQS